MRIQAYAPATTANLGPGFDCLGAAVTLGVEVWAEVPGTGRRVVEADEPDLAPDLVLDAAAAIAGALPPLDFRMRTRIPIGRGLGSSGAAIAAGLLVGCAIAGREPVPAELLEAGLPLEGHPDNLAASLYGGLTLVVPDGPVLRFEPSARVRPVVLVPAERQSTSVARGVLPSEVRLADAVATAARTAGLVAMLTGSAEPTPERLLACTTDVLHQPHRAALMPRTARALELLRARGAAAVMSGAGPSILCLTIRGDEAAVRDAAAHLDGWTVHELDWDPRGARLQTGEVG